jgi:hypothetical protein
MQALVDVVQAGGGGSVPEPASWALIASGLVGAFLLRKKIAQTQNNRA